MADADDYRREEICRMVAQVLARLVASRPGEISGSMIESCADKTHEACTAIFDVCERFRMSPAQREKLEEQERKAEEKAAKDTQKAADKALEEAVAQDKKDADAKAALAKLTS